MNKRFLVFIVLSIVSVTCYALVLYPLSRGVPSTNVTNVSGDLGYLGNLSDVSWYVIDDNDVYIGLNTFENRGEIVRAAALNGHKSLGRGFHAWGVDASVASTDWRPGSSGFLCEATARNGFIEKSDCP